MTSKANQVNQASKIMAGHSKWANIKRQKARVDAKRGKTFTQLSRAIIVAARNGVADPAGNFQLRTAIDKAKAAGIPNENIDRAIAKGARTYEDGKARLEEIRYEGYGAGGVAILVEVLTDNRNRTAADLREAFKKNGGNLGESGCVAWMFAQKGVALVEGNFTEDQVLEACLEGEAEYYEFSDAPLDDQADRQGKTPKLSQPDQSVEIFTTISNLEHLSQILKQQKLPVTEAEWRWIPSNTIEITEEDGARSILKLLDTLENLDDVQSVTANWEMSEELMQGLL
jgi:YebC/PmpR family DNA-binding regulatory protein